MDAIDDRDDDELTPAELDARTQALQATVAAIEGSACRSCGERLCGHGALLAVQFGCKDAPRCPDCLAAEQREEKSSLLHRAGEWRRRKDCFQHVWQRAGIAEHGVARDLPPCLGEDRAAAAPPSLTADAAPAQTPIETYDAGDLGCGDLVLELRNRLRAIAPGAVLRVFARDPAAPVDLPAWCGLTGHTLAHAAHPEYHVQRKRD
jgi:tRNA 2-thiouridine synthesizing protein A